MKLDAVKLPVMSLNQIALGSLAVSLVVLAVKYAAFLMTGSVALYSDALESIINVATALAAIVAIRVAARPPDEEHPYGHHKAEYISAVAVGVLIILAALAILREAYEGFLAPHPIEAPALGLAISTAATLLNALWSRVLVRQGRAQRSAALQADGKHLMADVVTSLGVLAGVTLVVVTGIERLDPALAALVALHVLWSGGGVVRENVSALMDEAAPAEDLSRIKEVIASKRRWLDRGPRPQDAARRQGHFHRFPSRGVLDHDGRRGPRHLRPDRGRAETGASRRADQHPRRAGIQGEALGHRPAPSGWSLTRPLAASAV